MRSPVREDKRASGGVEEAPGKSLITTPADMLRSLVIAVATLAPSLAAAFSFTFGSTPTQCQNATINIIGNDGVPPYNIVILAYGHPPGGNEVRKIISHDWTGQSTSVEIAFPSNSQFVAVVSTSVLARGRELRF